MTMDELSVLSEIIRGSAARAVVDGDQDYENLSKGWAEGWARWLAAELSKNGFMIVRKQ
jgi:hypothetical protein